MKEDYLDPDKTSNINYQQQRWLGYGEDFVLEDLLQPGDMQGRQETERKVRKWSIVVVSTGVVDSSEHIITSRQCAVLASNSDGKNAG